MIFLAILLTFGFPFVGYISSTLGIPSTPIAIFFRFSLLSLSLFLILNGVAKSPIEPTRGIFFLLFFWVIYSIRIIWDISIIDIERRESYTPFVIYSFAFGNCLMPLVAIALITENLDVKKLLNFALVILFFQNLLIFSLLYKEFGISLESLLIRQRVTGFEGKGNVLNPISLSRAGGLLFILCLSYLSLFKTKSLFKIFLYFSILLSLYILFAGGSRGPMLATILTSLLLLFYYFRTRKLKGYLSISFVIIPLFAIIINGAQSRNITSKSIAAIGRLESTIIHSQEEVRITMWKGAWNQFLASPVIGDSMLEREFQFYPHNIIVESLMATGIVGSFFLFGSLVFFFKRIYKSYKIKHSVNFVFGLLVFFNLMGYMTSGSLYMGVQLWPLLGLYLIIKI